MPKVSVIIPSYNRADCVCDAIDSVLAQTYRDFETIVVDDGSTDETLQVLRNYRNDIRCLRRENGGAGAARNLGILSASGDYVAFLDSDDIMLPRRLEYQVAALDRFP